MCCLTLLKVVISVYVKTHRRLSLSYFACQIQCLPSLVEVVLTCLAELFLPFGIIVSIILVETDMTALAELSCLFEITVSLFWLKRLDVSQ